MSTIVLPQQTLRCWSRNFNGIEGPTTPKRFNSLITHDGGHPAKPAKTYRVQDMTKSHIEPCAEIRHPVQKLSPEDFSKKKKNSWCIGSVPWTSCVVSPMIALSASRSHCFHWTGLAKVRLQAITAVWASLHMRRCQLMNQFHISDKFQSERLLFNDKVYHEKVIPDYNFTFCITQHVVKEVTFKNFTESTSRLIQSSSLTSPTMKVWNGCVS